MVHQQQFVVFCQSGYGHAARVVDNLPLFLRAVHHSHRVAVKGENAAVINAAVFLRLFKKAQCNGFNVHGLLRLKIGAGFNKFKLAAVAPVYAHGL